MNLRDFQYLAAIADEKHFGRAAESCHVSQSTLSIQLRKLEEYLGVQLVERNHRQVMLTPVGEKICARARVMLRQASDIRQIAKDESDPLAGEVALGAFPTLAPYVFPLCAGAIKRALPKITVRLVEEKTDVLLTMLESGKLDCALVALPVERVGIVSMPLFYEPFTLAVPVGHPLARKRSVTDAELAELSLLLLDEGHCLRSQALEICHSIGTGESRKFRATSLETLRQMVAMGEAVTLMPQLAVRKKESQVRYVPLRNNAFGRTIALCWRETSARQKLFETLAGCIAKNVGAALEK